MRAVDALRERGVEPARVVVTKVRRGALGAGPEQQVAEVVRRYLGEVPTTLLPWAPDVLDAALLAGRSLADAAPTAPLREPLRSLAAVLSGAEVPAPTARRQRLHS